MFDLNRIRTKLYLGNISCDVLVTEHDLLRKDILVFCGDLDVNFVVTVFDPNRFQEAKAEASKIAIAMDIEPMFNKRNKRLIKRKTHFDEERDKGDDVCQVLSVEDDFRINYFFKMMDQAIVSFQTRLEQFKEYENIFGFLFSLRKLNSTSDDILKSKCSNLEAFLKHGADSDIDMGMICSWKLKFLEKFCQRLSRRM